MKRKELTKTLLIISNWKKQPFDLHDLNKINSALQGLISEPYITWWYLRINASWCNYIISINALFTHGKTVKIIHYWHFCCTFYWARLTKSRWVVTIRWAHIAGPPACAYFVVKYYWSVKRHDLHLLTLNDNSIQVPTCSPFSSTRPVFSHKIRYIVGFGLVEMAEAYDIS